MKHIENLSSLFSNKNKQNYILWLLLSFISTLLLIITYLKGGFYLYSIIFVQVLFVICAQYFYFKTKNPILINLKHLLIILFSLSIFLTTYFLLTKNFHNFAPKTPSLFFLIILPLSLVFSNNKFARALLNIQLFFMVVFITSFWVKYKIFFVYDILFYLNFWVLFRFYLYFKSNRLNFISKDLPLNYKGKIWAKEFLKQHLNLELKIANEQNTSLGVLVLKTQVALEQIQDLVLDFECLFKIEQGLYLILVFELNLDSAKRRVKNLQENLKNQADAKIKLAEVLDTNLPLNQHLEKIEQAFNLEKTSA